MNLAAINQSYTETVTNLRLSIETKYDTVTAFCNEHSVDRHNLSKVFNFHQDISVHLYLKCCVALGILPATEIEHQHGMNLSLKEYLCINNNAIYQSVLHLNFS